MKKLIHVLIMMLLCFGISPIAYAGSINSNEQAVLSAAERTYTYQGVRYKVDPSYISQLKAYLMSDDIDLTAQQRDTALASVNSYIEKGVKEHYLVPVNGQSDKSSDKKADSDPSDADSSKSDSSKSDSPKSDSPKSDSSKSNSSKNSSSESDITEEDIIKIDYTQAGKEAKNNLALNNTGKSEGQTKSKSDVDKFMKEIFTVNNSDSTTPSEKAKNSKTADQNKDAIQENAENHVIKDTGFDFSSTLFVVVFMIVIMIMAIYVTIRYRYFTQIEES